MAIACSAFSSSGQPFAVTELDEAQRAGCDIPESSGTHARESAGMPVPPSILR